MNNMCNHAASITFRKATASGGNNTGPNCVEVGQFTKATKSNPIGNCVEVAYATASNSGQTCVEVAHAKASRSGAAGHCVEPGVATDTHTDCTPETCRTPGITAGDVVVRDSKLGEQSPLAVFPMPTWRQYVAVVIESGMEADGDGGFLLRDPRNPGNILHFNRGEADAFQDGCTRGEFNYDLHAAVA